MWNVRLTICLEGMASKAKEKRKYIIGENQECNEFLPSNIRYKNMFKTLLNHVNIETQDNTSIIAYRPVKSRTVIELPVTYDCAFLLSLMLLDWACSTNYIEKLPNIKKVFCLMSKSTARWCQLKIQNVTAEIRGLFVQFHTNPLLAANIHVNNSDLNHLDEKV